MKKLFFSLMILLNSYGAKALYAEGCHLKDGSFSMNHMTTGLILGEHIKTDIVKIDSSKNYYTITKFGEEISSVNNVDHENHMIIEISAKYRNGQTWIFEADLHGQPKNFVGLIENLHCFTWNGYAE